MAYSAGGLKAIMNLGGNTVWFFTTDDTHATAIASGYFNADYQNLKKGDIILASTDMDGTAGVALLAVTSADAASTVTVTDNITST